MYLMHSVASSALCPWAISQSINRHAVFHYPSSCHKTRKVFAVVFSLAVIILYNIARYISIGIVDKNIVRYMYKMYIAHYNGGVVY